MSLKPQPGYSFEICLASERECFGEKHEKDPPILLLDEPAEGLAPGRMDAVPGRRLPHGGAQRVARHPPPLGSRRQGRRGPRCLRQAHRERLVGARARPGTRSA